VKTLAQALMRQLHLFDDSYEVYMILSKEEDVAGNKRAVEVLRITGQEDTLTTVMIS